MKTLVDAGPLVAFLSASDEAHAKCLSMFRSLREPLLTVWPAFTEAAYLLSFSWKAQEALFEMIEGGVVGIATLDEADVPRIRELMQRYRDLPMDLADAALVRVAERERIRRVFTLDRRDFLVYRPLGLKHFTVVP